PLQRFGVVIYEQQMRHVVLSGEIEPIALRKMHTMRTRFAFPRALKRLAKVESAPLSPRGVNALPFLQMARCLHHGACPAGRRSRTLPSSPPRARPVGLFLHAHWQSLFGLACRSP